MISVKLNMARAHTKLGHFTTARHLLQDVIAVYTEWWGRHRPETMHAVDELALTYKEEGEHNKTTGRSSGYEIEKAEELWNEISTFCKIVYGDESDMMARIKSNLQYLYSIKKISVPNPCAYNKQLNSIFRILLFSYRMHNLKVTCPQSSCATKINGHQCIWLFG